MKAKQLSLAIAAAMLAVTANAEITVTVENGAGKQLVVKQASLSPDNAVSPESIDITLDANGTAKFKQASSPVVISIMDGSTPVASRVFSASDAENIHINADGQGTYQAAGTPLVEGVTNVNKIMTPYMERFRSLAELYNTSPEEADKQINELESEMNTALLTYIKNAPAAPEAPYALMMLDGQEFLDAYPLLTDASRQSILMPSVEQKKASEERSVAQEKRMRQLESGNVQAPAFTLPDLEGKQVSLSDFRGKWVVIDFWGSWCRWCVKGFPELKELSQKYGDDLVIIGVDCRDSRERWREAVKKYDLTWVNVYNDCSEDQNPLLEAYAVQGFPTKVIVGPDGTIKKIVVGADPSFPQLLSSFIGK